MAKKGTAFEQKIKAIKMTAENKMSNHIKTNIKISDINGCKRELDVLVENLVFECKDYKAGVGEIDAAIGKYKDLPQVKNVAVVASKGFTQDAQKKAKGNDINLFEIKKKDKEVETNDRRYTCVKRNVCIARCDIRIQQPVNESELSKLDSSYLYDYEGNITYSSKDIIYSTVRALIDNNEFDQMVAIDYSKNFRGKINVMADVNVEQINLFVQQPEEPKLLKVKSLVLFLLISFEEQDYEISEKEQLVESSSKSIEANIVRYDLEGQMPILGIDANNNYKMYAIDEHDNTRMIKVITPYNYL